MKPIQYPLFAHKAGDRLIQTKSNSKDGEVAESCKFLFRTFLEEIISNDIEVTELGWCPNPDAFYKNIRIAYLMSDFDWRNREQFIEFGNWYFSNF